MRKTSTTKIKGWNDKKIVVRWLMVGCLTIFGCQLVSAAVVSDLYGTWNGTWFVDEVHDELNPSTPLAFQVDFQMDIGPFNPVAGNYGTIILDTSTPGVISAITVAGDDVKLVVDYPALNIKPGGRISGTLTGNTIVGDFDEIPTAGFLVGKGALEISKTSAVSVTADLSGTIKTPGGTGICAMVLASGQFMFSCNPAGSFALAGLPLEQDGTAKRQIYADGFFPKIDILNGSSNDTVVLTRSGACPSYNATYNPAFVPGSAGKHINITGKVLTQDSQTPICAMVLANGQHTFSCNSTGSYALNIPLDTNGQFKVQVYADGFAPMIQSFDEFKTTNNMRMARAAECDAP